MKPTGGLLRVFSLPVRVPVDRRFEVVASDQAEPGSLPSVGRLHPQPLRDAVAVAFLLALLDDLLLLSIVHVPLPMGAQAFPGSRPTRDRPPIHPFRPSSVAGVRDHGANAARRSALGITSGAIAP